MNSSYVKLLAISAAGALLAGCGGSSSNTGQLKLAITDAPADKAASVFVAFTGIEVKPADGPAFMLNEEEFEVPIVIDVKKLQDGISEQLVDATVPAGQYNWVRLAVSLDDDGALDPTTESYIEINQMQYPLWVPSGSESGLKLNRGFIVPQGGVADFTIDFDLRKSVHLPMNGEDRYVLRPTLRIVDNTIVGSIYGNVGSTLPTGEASSCVVYAYEGEDRVPDNVGSPTEALTSAGVKLDLVEDGQFGYRVAFLLPGTYTVALTCEARDDLTEDDDITFTSSQTRTIPAEGGDVRADFHDGS